MVSVQPGDSQLLSGAFVEPTAHVSNFMPRQKKTANSSHVAKKTQPKEAPKDSSSKKLIVFRENLSTSSPGQQLPPESLHNGILQEVTWSW